MRAKELGHFIAKARDNYMQSYLQKFDMLYKGKKEIDIEFIDEHPLSIKLSRFNQSGEVCYCPDESNQANQKTSEGWKKTECKGSECPYRQAKENGQPDCKKIGWLKFLIPTISRDRIWLMRITNQTTLTILDNYFALQQSQGNSIKGLYILFLKKEKKSKFSHYVIDILRKSDLESTNQIPPKSDKEQEKNTLPEIDTTQKIKNNKNEHQTVVANDSTTHQRQVNKMPKVIIEKDPDIDKCYYFVGHHTEEFLKDGKPKEYFIGDFNDMTDKPISFVIRPEFKDIILHCGLGSIFEFEIQNFKDKKIVTNLKFVKNDEKKIAA